MAVLLPRDVIGASFSSCTDRQTKRGAGGHIQRGFTGRKAQHGQLDGDWLDHRWRDFGEPTKFLKITIT
ncbi:hypothetical protein THF1C08_20316 [Vibrio jasicida]|uniref:Uncharacterized protein n=1 Tax=Vibrio jasicida TaxID=766224 RepID=A0AAU9QK11_9VIBR|nr:hypothetical protein THF1C08_20316 [Vibrio jasicida]CAH1586743.1 hypothetical protein THF1A12_20318 [Vibrio jasicida]